MKLNRYHIIVVVLVGVLMLWLLSKLLWDKEPETFRYAVVAGGFDGPTDVTYFRLNQTMNFPLGGYLSGGSPDRTIFGSSMGLYKPEPVPYQVDARWFSFQDEQFYQIRLEIPEKKQQAIRDFYRQYPERNHTHSLQLGISGEGDLRLYWEAFCSMIEGCPSEPRKQLEIYDRVSARKLEVEIASEELGFYYVYRRERLLCDGIVLGEPKHELPEDLLSTSDELTDYAGLQVSWLGFRKEPFSYQLDHRDGSVTLGSSESGGRSGWIEWEDPYNPPYRMILKDADEQPIGVGFSVQPGGVGVSLDGAVSESGHIYLDQRFLLPSREYFEWPQWAQEMRWQDFRPECKISTYVRLRDVDGEVVAGGVYELVDNETGEVLMKERTDMQGFTRVRRSDYLSNDWSFQ